MDAPSSSSTTSSTKPSISRHEMRTLPLCADCVEFCPFPEVLSDGEGKTSSSEGAERIPDIFVCGNYHLDEQSKKKQGAIFTYACRKVRCVLDTQNAVHGVRKHGKQRGIRKILLYRKYIFPSRDLIIIQLTHSLWSFPVSSAPKDEKSKGSPDRQIKSQYALQQLAMRSTSAIFDLKWCPKNISEKGVILAEAAEDGFLTIYKFSRGAGKGGGGKGIGQKEGEGKESKEGNSGKDQADAVISTSILSKIKVVDSKPCLSLDWSSLSPTQSDNANKATPSGSPVEMQICVSQGDKAVSLWRLSKSHSSLVKTAQWEAHSIDEVWACNFDPFDANVLYTGADDCKFNIWDIRGGGGSGGPVVANGNHEAGVTVIAPHPSYEHVLATGSYDEKVRVYDKRNFYRPLSTFETGGGVWRLRWNKSVALKD
eukprot:jgi/Bigna1/82708/fgenesh1_pg.96_\